MNLSRRKNSQNCNISINNAKTLGYRYTYIQGPNFEVKKSPIFIFPYFCANCHIDNEFFFLKGPPDAKRDRLYGKNVYNNLFRIFM